VDLKKFLEEAVSGELEKDINRAESDILAGNGASALELLRKFREATMEIKLKQGKIKMAMRFL
jgi:hypothetical protein